MNYDVFSVCVNVRSHGLIQALGQGRGEGGVLTPHKNHKWLEFSFKKTLKGTHPGKQLDPSGLTITFEWAHVLKTSLISFKTSSYLET